MHEINVQFESGLYKKNGRYRQRIKAQSMFKRMAFKKDTIILSNLFINRVQQYIEKLSAEMTFSDRVFLIVINPIVHRYNRPYMKYYSQWFMFNDIINMVYSTIPHEVDINLGGDVDEQSMETEEETV